MPTTTLPPCLRAEECAALERFTGLLRANFGERVRDLRLFGSRARGEGHPESDVDVLVVIDGLSGAERDAVWGATGDILDSHQVMVGALVVSSGRWDELRARERLIVAEIDRDGISL